MKKRYICFIAIAVIICVPVIVNLIMLCNSPFKSFQAIGDYSLWIPFLGSLFGALIAGLITIFVLSKTIKANERVSERTLKANKDSIYIAHKKEDLNRYIYEIANKLSAYDPDLINKVGHEMIILGNFDKASEILNGVKINILTKFLKFDLIFRRDDMSPIEKDYFKKIKCVNLKLEFFIADLNFIISLLKLLKPMTKQDNMNKGNAIVINECIKFYQDIYSKQGIKTPEFNQYYENDSPLASVYQMEVTKYHDANKIFNELGGKSLVILEKINEHININALHNLSKPLIKEKREEIEALLKD